MESGSRPPPPGVGGAAHGRDPPPGHATSPTTPPPQHTTYDRSVNDSIDHIKKTITNLASKYTSTDPVQPIFTCFLEIFLPLLKEISLLNHHNKALHSKLDTLAPALEHTVNLHSPQPLSWSAIVAGGLPAQPRFQRQGPPLAAVTAPTALKSPPQQYQRELVAHCNKDAAALEYSAQRLVEELNRATR